MMHYCVICYWVIVIMKLSLQSWKNFFSGRISAGGISKDFQENLSLHAKFPLHISL